jgi:hypothetical protein
VQDPIFWQVVHVKEISLQPVDHLLAFAHQTFQSDELESKGNTLSRLICGKARQLQAEHEAPLRDLSWATSVYNNDKLPLRIVPELIGLMVGLCLYNAAAFNRRVVVPYTRWP